MQCYSLLRLANSNGGIIIEIDTLSVVLWSGISLANEDEEEGVRRGEEIWMLNLVHPGL